MAELALGVVGVVPLLIGAIKGLRTFSAYLKTARKCIKHLKDIELDLQLQHLRFTNECTLLLLQIGEDELCCRLMAADPEHKSWSNVSSLEARIGQALGDDYEMCAKVIHRINELAWETARHLECFDIVWSQKLEEESWKITFRRVYQPLKFGVDKNVLEKKIAILRRKNKDLEALRRHADQLRRASANQMCTTVAKPMPRHFFKIQEVSNEVYGALSASFHCNDASHDEHTASLCLDADVVNGVCLNMAISYIRRRGIEFCTEPPVRFLLQSKEVDIGSKPELSKENSGIELLVPVSKPGEPTKLQPIPVTANRDIPHDGSNKSRKRRVMFAEPLGPSKKNQNQVKHSRGNDGSKSSTTGPTLNLCAMPSPCEYLVRNCSASGTIETYSESIAFLRKSNLSRYIFYISKNHLIPQEHVATTVPCASVSLCDYLKTESESAITVVHQIKLALKLSLAVLQYHSTPWLGDEWSTAQLQLLPSEKTPPEDFPLYLKSKLLGAVSAQTPCSASPLDMPMMDRPQSRLPPAERLGIYNTTVFCLGMALLEIGYWKSMADLHDQELDQSTVDTVRRLANGTVGLGARFDEVIRKCIRCDFAYGSDLRREELQVAFYSQVVCPLEELIGKLDGLSI